VLLFAGMEQHSVCSFSVDEGFPRKSELFKNVSGSVLSRVRRSKKHVVIGIVQKRWEHPEIV
jgi:hypothetical protein